jgi:hypothetical protein
MKRQSLAKIGLVLMTLAILWSGAVFAVQAAAPLPVLTVAKVIPGGLVQLGITNLTAGVEYAVRMGAAGTHGIGGSLIAHFTPNSEPSQLYWFEILSDLRKSANVDLMIDNGAGSTAWISFNNAAIMTVVTATPTATPVLGSGGVVTGASNLIRVLRVERDGILTVEVHNLPLSTDYKVTIGPVGSHGFGGYVVAHLPVGTQDTVIGTFEIPVLLKGSAQMDLRLEGQGFLLFTTFDNVNK